MQVDHGGEDHSESRKHRASCEIFIQDSGTGKNQNLTQRMIIGGSMHYELIFQLERKVQLFFNAPNITKL